MLVDNNNSRKLNALGLALPFVFHEWPLHAALNIALLGFTKCRVTWFLLSSSDEPSKENQPFLLVCSFVVGDTNISIESSSMCSLP